MEALEIIGGLRGMGRGVAATAGLTDPALNSRRKLLHEEIALLWTMSNSSSRDAVFSNSWYLLVSLSLLCFYDPIL